MILIDIKSETGFAGGRLLDTDSSTGVLTPESLTPLTTTTPFPRNEYGRVVATLLAALPPKEDIDVMIEAGINISFHTLMTQPHHLVEKDPGGWATDLSNIPDARTHPVIIARYLLILASCFQFVNPDVHAEALKKLSDTPTQLIRRFAEPAITLVNNNDDFQGCIEGLECIMLETMYQANNGNVRRAWFVCRRAMVIAQMMGLHRRGVRRQQLKILEPDKVIYPSYFWFRIIWSDRLLSLGLGLPQGSLDTSIASEASLANDTPSDRFERKQSVIISRIIERNESSDFSTLGDLKTLRELDLDLQNAAAEMPSNWWLIPTLANLDDTSEVNFWETLRLVEQIMYFNLIIMLHLPYMLRSNSPNSTSSSEVLDSQSEYSKLACVNASRELLTRFIMFRSFNRVAFCCRSTDFHALIGAMTLVIGHLDGHRKQRQQAPGMAGINLFGHQRNSDRAMMDRVLETMESVADLNEDMLSERSSRLLRSLLALEADAAKGQNGNANKENFAAAAEMAEKNPDAVIYDGQSLRIGIPYFGTIRIGREGNIAMETPRAAGSPPLEQQMSATTLNTSPSRGTSARNPTGNQASDGFGVGILPPVQSSYDGVSPSMLSLSQQVTQGPSATDQPQDTYSRQPFAPEFPSSINDALQQQYLYPGLTAGADDWAFQGIDMTFFSSLLRGSGGDNVGDGSDWTSWDATS